MSFILRLNNTQPLTINIVHLADGAENEDDSNK